MIRKVLPTSKPFAFPTRIPVFSQSAASTELVLDFLPPPLLQSFALVTYWEVVPTGFEPFPNWRPLRLPTIRIKAPTMSCCSQGFGVVLAAGLSTYGVAVYSTLHSGDACREPRAESSFTPERGRGQPSPYMYQSSLQRV